MSRVLAALLLTAAAGVASADGSGSAAPQAPKKLNTEEAPVPMTPLIIAGVALAAFSIVLLVGRRKKMNQRQQPQRMSGDLAEVRLVIETDESATITCGDVRVSTDRLGEAVLNLPVGSHEVTIEVGVETFRRTVNVTSVKRMRMPINLTKERISRGVSGEMPPIARTTSSKPLTSMARAYPDSSTQAELGDKLAGLIDVEIDKPAAPMDLVASIPSPRGSTTTPPPRAAGTTKSPPLSLDFSTLGSQTTPAEPLLPLTPAPALELEEDLDLQLPSNVPASTLVLPPQPVRASALAGAPPSAPAVRSSPLRDIVEVTRTKQPTTQPAGRPPPPLAQPALGSSSTTPKPTKADRQQAANAIGDFALDDFGRKPSKRAESVGPIPDLDLAPPTQAPQRVEPSSTLNIGEFALSDFGPPPASIPLEMPKVTAQSVADLTIDDDLAIGRAPASEPSPARLPPSIGDFELTPPPQAPPTPGRATRSSISPLSAIGNRYRKTGGAGVGPLGALYRGRDEAAERDVWIEELPRDVSLAVPPAQLAKLEHANIMRFYEHVTDATKSYLVTELVEGKSLETLITELGGVVSALQAIAIVDQICAALAYAHQHGVFHRNVRPACVWISGRSVKLTSFGITLGRPTPYQAPELAAGGQVDVRSDLYSVGIVLAQLLTGTVPSAGNVELPADVPRSLAGMIRKLISREAMIRPNNIKVVRDTFSSMF